MTAEVGLISLMNFCATIRDAYSEAARQGINEDRAKSVALFLAALLDRLADFNSSLCVFNYTGGRGVVHTFGRQALPMVWDFAETNVFNPEGASWVSGIEDLPAGLRDAECPNGGHVTRGSATGAIWPEEYFDAVITDPPYYDNIGYAILSDFFYVWLKRSIGYLFPEHFTSFLTPKKSEIVADPVLHSRSRQQAKTAYEIMMLQVFQRAGNALRKDGQFVVVYAHKTTLGWATLVDALRQAGMIVNEAWPLDTEKSGRLIAQETAALASSIFLVAHKRRGQEKGTYETQVRPELEHIVRERVETLWDLGISGADIVIACVGAGLRAFTRFARVEYANGEEVPAERFLTEVETVVLDQILTRLSKEVGGNGGRQSLAGVDPATRFYTLWRYTYRTAELDAGETIIFAHGAHVELDGPRSVTHGARALVEKKKSKYRLRDYTQRGDDEKLGMPATDGSPAPLIDALHRTL